MNVNHKGDIGLTKVLADLTGKLYSCFIPLSGSCPVNLVVGNSKMELRRLQVKYRNLDNGLLVVQLHTVINGVKTRVDTHKIDGWAVYCPETDTVYYLAKTDVDVARSRFSLRVAPAKQAHPHEAPGCHPFQDETRLWRGTQEAEGVGLLNQ